MNDGVPLTGSTNDSRWASWDSASDERWAALWARYQSRPPKLPKGVSLAVDGQQFEVFSSTPSLDPFGVYHPDHFLHESLGNCSDFFMAGIAGHGINSYGLGIVAKVSSTVAWIQTDPWPSPFADTSDADAEGHRINFKVRQFVDTWNRFLARIESTTNTFSNLDQPKILTMFSNFRLIASIHVDPAFVDAKPAFTETDFGEPAAEDPRSFCHRWETVMNLNQGNDIIDRDVPFMASKTLLYSLAGIHDDYRFSLLDSAVTGTDEDWSAESVDSPQVRISPLFGFELSDEMAADLTADVAGGLSPGDDVDERLHIWANDRVGLAHSLEYEIDAKWTRVNQKWIRSGDHPLSPQFNTCAANLASAGLLDPSVSVREAVEGVSTIYPLEPWSAPIVFDIWDRLSAIPAYIGAIATCSEDQPIGLHDMDEFDAAMLRDTIKGILKQVHRAKDMGFVGNLGSLLDGESLSARELLEDLLHASEYFEIHT